MNWQEEIEFNKQFVDSLPLREPRAGEDLEDYIDEMEEHFKDQFPSKLQGCLFNFLSFEESIEYLEKRFHKCVYAVIKYYLY